MKQNAIETEINAHIEQSAPLSTVHKCAKLVFGDKAYSAVVGNGFDPHTKKADLMDVECALGIDVLHDEEYITAEYWQHGLLEFDDKKRIANYAHNKFTARAHAVCAVAEQIYDKGQSR